MDRIFCVNYAKLAFLDPVQTVNELLKIIFKRILIFQLLPGTAAVWFVKHLQGVYQVIIEAQVN
jgi:hypothetical protein